MWDTWELVLYGVLAAVGLVSQIAIGFAFNYRAMDRGYGEGRDAIDWTLRGTFGTPPYSILGPTPADRGSVQPSERMVCPQCGVLRRLYEGRCSYCGTNVIEALIDEAQVADSAIQHSGGVPRGSTSDFPDME